MKIFHKNSIITIIVLAASFILGLIKPIAAIGAGPAPVNLLSTNNFVILSKTGITNTGSHTSAITGNIGSSPITAAAMDNVFCSEITGTIYGVDAAYTGSGVTTCFAGNPPLSNKTLVDNAVLDMGTAYTNAAGRTLPNGVNLYGGNLGGRTFVPGLYKWSTNVTIPTNVTLFGGTNSVWIFQIAGDLSIASGGSVPAGIKVILAGGAKASNIFWQVGGPTGATLGTYSTFNGNILSAKQIIMQTGAVLNGRALAQTQVTLDANVVSVPVNPTEPSPSPKATPTPKVLGEISGTKYEDRDGDGKLTNNDKRLLSGWTIYLDTDGNSVFDSGEPSTITDSRGNYLFSNLPAGTYIVREVIQSGWIQTYPAAGSYTIILATGETSKKSNFGNFKLGLISGIKFNDANGNSRKDNSETGLQDWTINLTKAGSTTVLASAVTDGNGNYSFIDLGPGTYQIREVQQDGWVQTTKNPSNIKMYSGTMSANNNFGNHFGPVKKNRGWCSNSLNPGFCF